MDPDDLELESSELLEITVQVSTDRLGKGPDWNYVRERTTVY